MISHLSLSYLSIVDVGNEAGDSRGAQGLREVLELYNFSDDPGLHQRIRGIKSVKSQPTRARVKMRRGKDLVPVFCHGTAIEIDFDEGVFEASGAFLFGCVLERFFALYGPVNSFVQLTATVEEGRRVLKQWPPRSGEQALL